jgi:hypothetical protein
MKISYFVWFKVASVWTVIVLSGLLVAGCSGGGDTAPTNSSHSTYNNSGKTAADAIGNQRRKARLPHGGDSAAH